MHTDESLDPRDELILTPDNRTIGVRILGPEYGVPVLTMHGNPGSRLGPHVGLRVLEELGVRLIAPDRPGYGLSDRSEGRSIIDTATDMRWLLDQLAIEECGVLARSGGVPHALACASALSDRIFGVVSFAALAPKTATIEWNEGMTEDNKAKHAAANESPEELRDIMQQHAMAIHEDSFHILDMLMPDLQPGDSIALIAEQYEQRTTNDMILSQHEGLSGGGYGWADDTLALHKEWGFDVESLTVPVLLWHGLQDPFASPNHSRWLAGKIPNATLVEVPDGSHMSSLLYGPEALRYLRNIYLGEDALARAEAARLETEARIYARFGVSPEQAGAVQPVDAGAEPFQGFEVTDEDLRRRVAADVAKNVLPALVEAEVVAVRKARRRQRQL